MRSLVRSMVLLFFASHGRCLTTRIFIHAFRQHRRTVVSSRRISGLERELPKKIAIVGGGLAGLSTAFHLLQKQPGIELVVYDKCVPGTGGASSVAGGLLHPLSPRGKLVHLGLEGIEASNKLVKRARDASGLNDNIVLRDEIYRLAVSEENVQQLQQTAAELPGICEWLESEELKHRLGKESLSNDVLGGLRLFNGCQVLHVPSYLQGLWRACQEEASSHGSSAAWFLQGVTSSGMLKDFDAIVMSAGSGLFQPSSNLLDSGQLPIQLVQGQSLEIRMATNTPVQAFLCGKYISPVPNDDHLVLVGATHEFKSDKMTKEQVVEELKSRTADFVPFIWQGEIETLTHGVRVQSARGKHGRQPIIGKLEGVAFHRNAWIFTGLSSRGLLYHGVFGDHLSDAILEGNEDILRGLNLDLLWWKRTKQTDRSNIGSA